MTTKQLLTKWQDLDPDKQAKVLAFIDSISQDNQEEELKVINDGKLLFLNLRII